MEIQCHSNPEIAARPCCGRVFQTEPVTKTRLRVAAEHRGGGADHDDFLPSRLLPRWDLAGPSATRPQDGGGDGVTPALGPNTCS